MLLEVKKVVYDEVKIRHGIDLVAEYESATGVFVDLFSTLKSHSAYSLVEKKKIVQERPKFKKTFDSGEKYYGKNCDRIQDF